MATLKDTFILFASVVFAGLIVGIVIFIGQKAHAATSFSTPSPFKQGGTSNTQIIPTYPTWSFNIPLSPPTSFAAASSTSPGGSLATSTTPIYFELAAINGLGTTTVSTELSTTTKTGSSTIHFSWTASPGATGYALFYSTTTPNALNAYQMATTTNQYDFTSTSSPQYAKPLGFPTAFSVQLSNTATPVVINGLSASAIATTTSAIGGGALTSGACATGTSTIPFGTLSSTTVFMTTPQKYPGAGVEWQSYALSSTQVVTQVCALLNVTPISTSYNVRTF
jgi:hypothetical protein